MSESISEIETNKKVLYIAGKMSGCSDFNFKQFDAAAELLNRAGYTAVNPADLDRAEGWSLERLSALDDATFAAKRADFLLRDLRVLSGCDGVALLSRWWDSAGARAELAFAVALGIPVYPLQFWLMVAREENDEWKRKRREKWTKS